MVPLFHPAVACALALVPLTLALGAQYGLGIRPCFLCHLQRVPWIGLAVLAGATWAHPSWVRWSVPVAWGLLAAGLALSAWHLGVEEGLLPQPSACGGAASGAASVEELLRQLRTAPPPCGQRAWSPIGVPWPVMNALALLAAAAVLLRWGRR
jgi:disulfide bond formation protein DsbB